jgi:hypothetical protein
MTEPFQPRIDEHGVGWCWVNCPYYKPNCICIFFGPGLEKHTSSHKVCIPWARLAAGDKAAVDVLRNGTIYMLAGENGNHQCNYGGVLGDEYPDPVDAIRAAAKQAKEKSDE